MRRGVAQVELPATADGATARDRSARLGEGSVAAVVAEQVAAALTSLNGALQSASLYDVSHPAVARAMARVRQVFAGVLRRRPRTSVSLIEGVLVVDDTPLQESPVGAVRFMEEAAARGAATLTFARGLTGEELIGLLEVMATSPAVVARRGGLQQELSDRGVAHIVAQQQLAQPPETESSEEARQEARRIYGATVEVVRQVMEDARSGGIIKLRPVELVVEDLTKNLLEDSSVLLGLASIKSYDQYTFTHSINVAVLSLALLSGMALDPARLQEIGVAVLLHDVGKVLIPHEILNKPSRLTEEEFEVVKRHPIDGARMLQRAGGSNWLGPIVALEHHARRDLSGYPTLVHKRALHFVSLVCSIADSYDALTTVRPYKRAWPPNEALREIREAGPSAYDPGLVERFAQMLGIYPVGSVVRLDTNELAIVTKGNSADPLRPTILLVTDPIGDPLLEPQQVDLARPPEDLIARTIVQSVNPAWYGIDVSELLYPLKPGEETVVARG
jgi:HD-GYP domain-containing protein (c-di-GMP phosphodiesterase class II)